MKRSLLLDLKKWANAPIRKPLLLRGARQVGKTFVVRQLGESFKYFIELNFEQDPSLKQCFNTLNPQDIVQAIAFIQPIPIIPGETLLFLDEIQASPQAIQALRYFKEQMPELHVIAAGSLLEFTLAREAISIPVGRIEYVYMYPCSFYEFLLNTVEERAIDLINNFTSKTVISDVEHTHMLKLCKEYFMVGGMPEALQAYISTKDWQVVQRIHNSILYTYRDDFGKYANLTHHKYLQAVYDRIPGMIGTQISYQKIDSEVRSRELKNAIMLLEQAGVLKHIYATTASGLPLAATLQEKKFKLHFLDIGLVQRKMGLNITTFMSTDLIQINSGGLAEQFVSQELLAYQDPFSPSELYFWARDARNAKAEVDYVIGLDGQIIPIEVKASAIGHLKSLQVFMQERESPYGIKISTAPLSHTKKIISVPFYLVSKLREVIKL